jgi:hypothetical protein
VSTALIFNLIEKFDIDDLDIILRHASIDAATRAARGLPEDLIRLCVGIEDPHDLLDDLERALLAAGAIEFDEVQNKYVRVAEPEGTDAITRAVQKLAVGDEPGYDTREWLVSAPGKVILFGEHAVVHGVVSVFLSFLPLVAFVPFAMTPPANLLRFPT